MDKQTRNILLGVGAIVVIGGGIYWYKNKDKKKNIIIPSEEAKEI